MGVFSVVIQFFLFYKGRTAKKLIGVLSRKQKKTPKSARIPAKKLIVMYFSAVAHKKTEYKGAVKNNIFLQRAHFLRERSQFSLGHTLRNIEFQ